MCGMQGWIFVFQWDWSSDAGLLFLGTRVARALLRGCRKAEKGFWERLEDEICDKGVPFSDCSLLGSVGGTGLGLSFILGRARVSVKNIRLGGWARTPCVRVCRWVLPACVV